MRDGEKGSRRKITINAPFNTRASLRLLRVVSPTIAAHTAAGRKSSPRKTGGAPTEKPTNVPRAIAKGPIKGPSTIPYNGATKSPALNVAPGTANIGNVGITLKTT